MNKAWENAVKNGDLPEIYMLLQQLSNLDSRDKHGQTGLMNAARLGLMPIVRCLVSAGADLNVTAKYGLSALMLAIVNCHPDVALVLIEAGADVGLIGSGVPGFAGKTALELAHERNLYDVISLLESRVKST